MAKGIMVRHFLFVNRTTEIPANKVKNMTMILSRRRIPIETSICVIGRYILTMERQIQYTIHEIIFIEKRNKNLFITHSSIAVRDSNSLASSVVQTI